jgi:hypothetical protein
MPSPKISNLRLSCQSRHSGYPSYTFQHYGKRQQDVYYLALCEGLELIGANPGLGHSRPDLPEPYKAYIVRKHVMVYKVKQDMVCTLPVSCMAGWIFRIRI